MRRALLLACLVAGACGRPAPVLPDPDTSAMERDVAALIERTRAAALDDPSAETLTAFGIALFAHRHHDHAEPVLLLAAEEEAADRHRLLHLAGLSASVSSLENAVAHMERACAVRRDYAPTHVKCGFFLEELDRLDEAQAHFEAALAVERNPHALLGLGRVALAKGDAAEATTHLEAVRAIDRGILEASVALAQAYAARGWEDKAALVEEEAAALRVPSHVDDPVLEAALDTAVSYSGRIDTAARAASAGEVGRAFRILDTAIGSIPERTDGHLSAGILLAQVGRHSDAVTAYDRVLHREPQHAEALARRGRSLTFLGREAEAEESLRAAVAAAPDALFARLELATFLQTGAPDEALPMAEALVEAQPRATSSRLLLARLLLRGERYDEALEHVIVVLRRSPGNREATLLRDAITRAQR